MTVAEPAAGSDLFGKTVSDLQSSIVIGDDAITGTLNYISDYSSAYPSGEDSGNYLALSATSDNSTVITAQVVGGTHPAKTIWDSTDPNADGIVICRITSTTQKIKLVATKQGTSVTKEYSLTGLTLAEADDEE